MARYISLDTARPLEDATHPGTKTIGRTGFDLFKTIICLALATFVLSAGFLQNGTVVAADDEKPEDTVNDSISDYECGDKNGDEGFENTWDCFEKNPENRSDDKDARSFGQVLLRLFTVGYLNETPFAVSGEDDESNPDGFVEPARYNDRYNCDVDAKGKGSIYYHNCDVPNIFTEFLQDMLSLFTTQGAYGAERELAKVDNQWFGLPSSMPGKGNVPTNPDERNVKYSGLELYGYHLKYTMYEGEWDHIKVFTPARAMSNFGFMSSLRLGVNSVINGIAGGVSKGAENFTDSISEGDLLGAIGGAFTGFFEGSAATSINTLLDSSDLNVFNTFAWYRVNYGKTVYGARELTDQEMSLLVQDTLEIALTDSKDKIELPEDFQKLENPPPKPKEAISSCSYKDDDGKEVLLGEDEDAPGLSQSECEDAVKEKGGEDATATWEEDGTQKAESIKSWKEDNSEWFEIAEKYDLDISVDVDADDPEAEISEFYANVKSAYEKAAREQGDKLRDENIGDWVEDSFVGDALKKSLAENISSSFNSPWMRFICVDDDGNDIIETDPNKPRWKFVYDKDGNETGECGPIRAPIQNGFFGNGYTADQEQPKTDTRYSQVNISFASVFFPIDKISTGIGNAGLGTASFVTRISNAALNLSFSPILETLGLDDIVTDSIEDFRGSIFFPFSVFFISAGALYIFFRAGRTGQYGKQFVSIGLMILTFISGSILMFKPQMAIDAVDTAPAKIEQAIIGSIYTTGNSDSDELCTVTGTQSDDELPEDLDGNALSNSPNEGTRALMCETWRVFYFNPWVFGQWGDHFNNLYSEDSGESNTLNNENTDLVGSGTVNMGDDTEVKNWALYQADVQTSGTTTELDPSNPAGQIDPNFYRLVDLQAGPNNGAGTDASHFKDWAGNDTGARAIVGVLSAAVAIFGMVTILIYSFNKIVITLMTVIMLLIIPFVFLLGLLPGVGRVNLKKYIFTIIGMVMQRIILITLLAVMMRLLVGIADSSDNYILIAVATITACLAFIFMRKSILEKVMSTMTDTSAAGLTENVGSKIRDKTPGTIKNYASTGKTWLTAGAAGAAGGFMTNGFGGMKDGWKDSADRETRKVYTSQRHAGFGGAQSMIYAGQAASRETKNDLKRNRANDPIKRDMDTGLQKNVDRIHNKGRKSVESDRSDENNEIPDNNESTPVEKYTGETERVKFGPKDKMSNKEARDLARLQRAREDYENAYKNTRTPKSSRKERKKLLENPDIESVKARQNEILGHRDWNKVHEESMKDRYDKVVDQVSKDEARGVVREERIDDFKSSLNRMRQTFLNTSNVDDESTDEDGHDKTNNDDRNE